MREVRIPQDRVAVLIGAKGVTKRMLQKRSGVRFSVDAEGQVLIDDETRSPDPLMVLKTADVIKAVGRGFSPERALRLLEDDEYLEVFDLKDYCNDRQLNRVRGRLIGAQGKTRRIIEDLTGVYMNVHGNTVSLIGNSVSLPIARHAVEMLLNGSEHSSVYGYLEGQRPRLRIMELGFDI
ncbi:MAG: RNA-processing protein [Thermoplasmatales archaeon]|nr:RNA-processing protein [Thermoplasmatales archaeon]